MCCRFDFSQAESISKPLQAAAAGKAHAHHVPFAAHGVAKGVQATGRIEFHFVAMNEHDARGADRRAQRALADDAVADRPCGAISCPADHDAVGAQAEFVGRRSRELAGHLFRFVAFGEEARVEFELGKQRLRPVALGDIQEQHAAGIAHVGGEIAGEPPPHVVLRQQHLRGLREIARLMIAEPENLRSGETGERRIGHELNQIASPTDALLHFGTFGGRALIVPQ